VIKITECPRDAMQGIDKFIPTDVKITYLNLLLKVGFHRIDFGSFVSPTLVPQMRDTAEVVNKLEMEGSKSSLLAIIANLRGATDASEFQQISYLGYPLSVSESFQKRNTNRTIAESLVEVDQIANHCLQTNTNLLVYLSMAFGNNDGELWNADIVSQYAARLVELGVKEIVLADTIGNSSPEKISHLYPYLKNEFPKTIWGLHLHSKPDSAQSKLQAALASGCDQFDTALRGFGGCPMAGDHLIGNIATETLLSAISSLGDNQLDMQSLQEAQKYSYRVFD